MPFGLSVMSIPMHFLNVFDFMTFPARLDTSTIAVLSEIFCMRSSLVVIPAPKFLVIILYFNPALNLRKKPQIFQPI